MSSTLSVDAVKIHSGRQSFKCYTIALERLLKRNRHGLVESTERKRDREMIKFLKLNFNSYFVNAKRATKKRFIYSLF